MIYETQNKMSDITKCTGEGCPLKESCYRYKVDSSMMQSYFIEPPHKDSNCNMYWGDNSQQVFNLLKNITNDNPTRIPRA